MNKKNCTAFISLPMNGKTYEEILDARKLIIKAMREQHDINITYITNDFDYTPECPARTVMLGNSIAKMEESAIIIFVKDYTEAKGCRVEYSVVKEYLEYWRENGGPRVFFECLDGCIIEVEQFNEENVVRTDHRLKDLQRIKDLEDRNQELENQLAKKSETIREQSVEIAALTNSNIYAKSKIEELTSELESAKEKNGVQTDNRLKDLQRIKDLEDECDRQAEYNKKLSIELADKKTLIEELYKVVNRSAAIRETQAKTLRDKDKRIEILKRTVNSIYGLSGGGFVCPDCKKKYEDRIKHLESCIDNYKTTIKNKNKDIDILLEAVRKIEASKYYDTDVIGKD